MLQYKRIDKYQISYIQVSGIFVLDAFYTLLRQLAEGSNGAQDLGPILFDLRLADFSNIDLPETRQHLIKVAAIDGDFSNLSCAYLVDGDTSYSYVRMANVFSELTGILPEERTLLSDNFMDVVNWIAELLNEDATDILHALEGADVPSRKSAP